MPFLLGKDCSLSAIQAGTLVDGSLRIRQALAAVSPAKAKTISTPAEDERAVQLFWNQIQNKSGETWKKPEQLPALQQILLAESKEHRRRLVAHVSDVKGTQASEILARLAIFDLDLEVREMAIAALRTRPKEEYRATLAHGLRYPWASVVDNATHVLVSLHMNETIPNLVALFDEPAPGSPYSEPGKDGKPKLMVRELVRVNHHRNCLLCHAPLDVSAEDARRGLSRLPVGPVTSAQEPLPPSRSTVYYASRKGITLVRADITYLRQDFSVQQKVENPGNWPAVQRFDFLVRTRELTSKEAEAWANKGVAHYLQSSVSSKYRETIADTLRRLTSKDAPATARAWREALGLPAPTLVAGEK